MSKFLKTLALDEATRIAVASSTITYVGKTIPGTLPNQAAWKISRLTSTPAGDLTVEFADSGKYTQIWDNRVGLTYT